MTKLTDSSVRLNRLKDLWSAGKPTFGVIVTIPSIPVVQILARARFDWLLIDMEHGPIDLAGAQAMIMATAGTPAVPFARVSWTIPWLAKTVLDLGALGICYPMIRSRADAEIAARSVRYPPVGDRLWGPFYAPLRWNLPMVDYMYAANTDVLAILTIEDPEAVRRIDEIVSTPGIDLAFIGPGDLATSLGHNGEPDHPKVEAAMAEAEAGILRSKVVLGGVARSVEQANRMVERGYRALVLGFGWSLLQRGATSALHGLRR
jgi:4-hydroxy-2-oxoheptanedioate aldolase